MKFKKGDRVVISESIVGNYPRLNYEQRRRGYLTVDSVFHGLDNYVAYTFVEVMRERWELKYGEAELISYSHLINHLPRPKTFKLKKR